MHPYTTGQVCFYNESLAETVGGKLRIRTTSDDVEAKYFAPDGTIGTDRRPYSSSMLQSWNKFCFTEGIVEMSVQMPGEPDQAGLWPGFWMMGNLGSEEK
eukprot:SAG31_NODE_20879_length_563_cov_1.213362_2_plen_99_part_01